MALTNLPRYDGRIERLKLKANKASHNKSYKEAINLYSKIIALKPHNLPEFLVKRGSLYVLVKEPLKALADYDQALQLDPYNLDAYNSRGILYVNDLKNSEKGLKDFDYATQLSSNSELFSKKFHSHILAQRGISKLNLSKEEEGWKDCLEAEKLLTKENPNILSCYTIYNAHLKRFEEAIIYADKLLKISPTSSNYYAHGFILNKLNKNKEALESLNKSVELGNKSWEVFYTRGAIYRDQKNYAAALEDLNKAIANGGENKNFLYGIRGTDKWRLKDYEGAYADYTQAIVLDEKDYLAYANRCEVLIALNKLDEAMQDCNKSMSLRNDRPLSYQYRARIYKIRGNKQLALNDALKAKELFEKPDKKLIDSDSDYFLLEPFIKSLEAN